MKKDDCYLLGSVTKPHGLKGEVAAFFDVDSPAEYENLESVFVEIDNKLVPFFIESISIQPQRILIAFEDVDSLEGAQQLQGKSLYLPLSTLPELDGDAFYFHELIGITAVDESFGPLGPITDVFSQGNQDLAAADHKGKEILFPLTDELIVRFDREQKELHLKLPEGLIDIYLSDNPAEEADDAD